MFVLFHLPVLVLVLALLVTADLYYKTVFRDVKNIFRFFILSRFYIFNFLLFNAFYSENVSINVTQNSTCILHIHTYIRVICIAHINSKESLCAF